MPQLASSLFGRVLGGAVVLATLLGAPGCIVEEDAHPHGPARVEFGEVVNLGYSCGGPLDTWTVRNRQTNEEATAVCEQPVLFLSLAPHTAYDFDITGQTSEGRVCWSGSCQVTTGGEASTTYPDCSSFIAHSCGF